MLLMTLEVMALEEYFWDETKGLWPQKYAVDALPPGYGKQWL
jgi:hypothetical protein